MDKFTRPALLDHLLEPFLKVAQLFRGSRLGGELQDKNQDIDADEPLADRAAGDEGIEIARPFFAVVFAVVNAHDARPRRGTQMVVLLFYHIPRRKEKPPAKY